MIDSQIIESSKAIRKKYLELVRQLNYYQEELRKLSEFLEEKVNEFKRIQDEEFKNKPTKDEINRVLVLIVKEIEEIEINERRLNKKFESLNNDLEQLQREEEILHKTIKARYPHMNDNQIRYEIQQHLDE